MRDEGEAQDIFYCVCCGRSESRIQITLRKFDAGFSGCCGQSMVTVPPILPLSLRDCGSLRCGHIKHAK